MKLLKRFDRFIKGELPEAEEIAFTKEIVREHFEEESLKEKWSKVLESDQELQSLKSAKTIALPNTKKPFFNRRIFFQIAAALLVLISAALALWRPLTGPNLDRLLAQELSDPYAISGSRESTVQIDETRLEANEAYRLKNYATAIAKYEVLNSASIATTSDHFYLGLSQLYIGNTKAAIAQLESINVASNVELPKETNWYLALAYMSNDQYAKAKDKLQAIATAGGWKNKEAKALLDSMPE